MNQFKLGNGRGVVNLDHVVMIERRDDIQFARLVSGSCVALSDVYPLAHELFRVSDGAWVNPRHVSIVGTGYNKSAEYQDMMKKIDGPPEGYIQVRVETVLGTVHQIWVDDYSVDEVDYLAELLGQGE